MAPLTRILFLAVSAVSIVCAAPVADLHPRQEPATVNFVPYAGPGCDMSTNPFDHTKPAVYNVTTSSGCITPPYAFASYVEEANAEADSGSCALSIFTGPDCTGSVSAATLTSYEDCVVGVIGQSFSFNCGP
ncbi:hypothetical protein MMC26_007415 [Xylographa opegraphella]|nr:hypothetical protein [Xylographa opegraphella]